MEGTDDKNCCCFCFDARTGVMIIGALLWIGVIAFGIQCSWLVFLALNDATTYYTWYTIPAVLIDLYLAILFIKVVQNEHKENDWETRKKFAEQYMKIGVILNGILMLLCGIAGGIQFSFWCNAYEDP